jgi:tRNA G18 (ribose-2'-O)-methylase SpoU
MSLVSLMLSPTARTAMAGVIEAAGLSEDTVLVREQEELDRITGFHLHQGCVALAERPRMEPMLPAGLEGPVIVLDRVADPDNVGSIVRTAVAFGAGGLLLGPGCADPFYRKAVRTSMGAVFVLHIATVPDAEWPGALDGLKAQGRAVVALAPDADVELSDVRNVLDGRPVAWLLGAEGHGLTPGVRAQASFEVKIAMTPMADSLNVAVAAAVALYAGRSE